MLKLSVPAAAVAAAAAAHTSALATRPAHFLISSTPSSNADDILVVAVGEQPATFGVKGVEEHCYFMKEVGVQTCDQGGRTRNRALFCLQQRRTGWGWHAVQYRVRRLAWLPLRSC